MAVLFDDHRVPEVNPPSEFIATFHHLDVKFGIPFERIVLNESSYAYFLLF